MKDFPKRKADGGAPDAKTDGRGRVDSAEGVAGEEPGTVSASGRPHTLYDQLAAILTNKDVEDPLAAIRKTLWLYAGLLASKRNSDVKLWSIYVERHIAGVRFILRDADGREVDLQALPANPLRL